MSSISNLVDALPNLGVSGTAAAIAELVTLPLDTAKVMKQPLRPDDDINLRTCSFTRIFFCVQVRLQLQNRAGGATAHTGSVAVITHIYRSEGFLALFKVHHINLC